MLAPGLRHFAVFIALGLNLLCVRPAHAVLGGDAASVLADTAELHGVAQATSLRQYDVHEIATDTGVIVREFLNRAGTVFAVTWSGPVVPDLKRLLSVHFDSYIKGLAALPAGGMHRSVRIASADLVVESGGHMRAYSGRAYLPALIPTGTADAELH